MDIRKLELIPRPIEAVQFTDSNIAELREWIQGKLAFQAVTGTPERLYLPSVGGTEILYPGDWVFYDRDDNTFKGATDEAVKNYYNDVTDQEE